MRGLMAVRWAWCIRSSFASDRLPKWPEFDPERRSIMIITADPYVQERPLAGVWALERDLPERD